MEAREPLGSTCHNERDNTGQWWIVWSADFPQDKPGRRPHPESIFLEEAYRAGEQKGMERVVKWVENNIAFANIPSSYREWRIFVDKLLNRKKPS